MATATEMKAVRRALAEKIATAGGTCVIGNGQVAEFTNPLEPPPVDTDDLAIQGAVVGPNGTNTTPLIQYLLPAAVGTGEIFYDDQEFTESETPTEWLLFTWTYGVSDAVGEWREILIRLTDSGAAGWKIHPVGTTSGWLKKTGQEERPVRFLLEL